MFSTFICLRWRHSDGKIGHSVINLKVYILSLSSECTALGLDITLLGLFVITIEPDAPVALERDLIKASVVLFKVF